MWKLLSHTERVLAYYLYTKLFISLSGELRKRKAVVNVQSTNKVQM
jgi:hypothetical protein